MNNGGKFLKKFFKNFPPLFINCIVYFQKLFSCQNLSLDFILKIFLKVHNFRPRYNYKTYSHTQRPPKTGKASLSCVRVTTN